MCTRRPLSDSEMPRNRQDLPAPEYPVIRIMSLLSIWLRMRSVGAVVFDLVSDELRGMRPKCAHAVCVCIETCAAVSTWIGMCCDVRCFHVMCYDRQVRVVLLGASAIASIASRFFRTQ